MKEHIISENSANQRLDKYLTKALPALPQSLLYKYLRLKRIKVNGKRADAPLKLKAGDVVTMYINDEFFEKDENTSSVSWFRTTGSGLSAIFPASIFARSRTSLTS